MIAAYCGSPGSTTLASLFWSLYCGSDAGSTMMRGGEHDAVELLQALDDALLLGGRALVLRIEPERAVDHGAEGALGDVPALRLTLLVELAARDGEHSARTCAGRTALRPR